MEPESAFKIFEFVHVRISILCTRAESILSARAESSRLRRDHDISMASSTLLSSLIEPSNAKPLP